MIPDVSSEAGWAAGIVTFLAAAAVALNKYSSARSETNRQVQNDNNAAKWQTDLLEENRSLRQSRDESWERRIKDGSEIAELKAERDLWKAKVESGAEMVAQVKRENETLRDELAHQRAQFALLENLAKK